MTKLDLKIVSGGQTGVDQGALKAALGLDFVWGGWVAGIQSRTRLFLTEVLGGMLEV